MPKVQADMSTVSTEYVPIEPGTHRHIFKKCEVKELDKVNGVQRLMYVIETRIYEPGEDDHNKPITTRVVLHKKDGDVNEVALADLKRFFEAIAPEMADDPEADTDALIEGHFMAETFIETYSRQGDPEGEPSGRSSRLKSASIRAVE